jgi:hypothetical protein
MGVSRDILTLLRASLVSYLFDSRIVVELYRMSLQDLESRNEYPYARIAIYELAENTKQFVEAYRANMTDTTYGIDISVHRGYQNLGAEDAELIMLDIKDKIVQWLAVTDFGTLTEYRLNYLGYQQTTVIQRNTKYTTQTLQLVAQKDFCFDQTQSIA